MEWDEMARALEATLQFNLAAEIERAGRFMCEEVQRRGVRGVVIGLSGGLDSTTCAFLAARCLPRDRIHLFSLPERDSDPVPLNNARLAARALNLPLTEIDLSGLLDGLGVYRQVPQKVAADRPLIERSIKILGTLGSQPSLYPWAQEYAFSRRRGWLARVMRRQLWAYAGRTESFIFGKVRARMLLLSLKAMQLDCLLVCTTDRSEYAVGFYDPHGDGVGDIAPLIHLYKTQIRALARELGVPEEILAQPSSGDLAAGLPNETAIGLSYDQLDRVLAGLSLDMADSALAAAAGVRRSMVKAVRRSCQLADERRAMPVRLEHLPPLGDLP